MVHGYNKSCGCSQRSSRLDYVGRKIGKLTVIERQGKEWLCRCECGNEVLKPNYFFKHEPSTVVDCGKHTDSNKHKNLKIDLLGKTFGDWTVIERDLTYTGHHVRYVCRNSKGEIKTQFAFYIQGLIEKESNKEILNTNLENHHFGNLTVECPFTEKRIGFTQTYKGKVYRTYYLHKKKYPQWVCKCNCGNKLILTSKDLLLDGITDCGCKKGLRKNSTRYEITKQHKEKDNTKYEGKKFGWLKIIKEVEEDDRGRCFLCKCKCGKEKVISLRNLKGGVCSCGCLKLKENRGNKEILLKKGKEVWKKLNLKKQKLENQNP